MHCNCDCEASFTWCLVPTGTTNTQTQRQRTTKPMPIIHRTLAQQYFCLEAKQVHNRKAGRHNGTHCHSISLQKIATRRIPFNYINYSATMLSAAVAAGRMQWQENKRNLGRSPFVFAKTQTRLLRNGETAVEFTFGGYIHRAMWFMNEIS